MSYSFSYQPFFEATRKTRLHEWGEHILPYLNKLILNAPHGDLPTWQQAIQSLPNLTPSVIKLNQDKIQIGVATDITEAGKHQLEHGLRKLMPWRKGPFSLFGLEIDTEWRSDFKWNRLANQIQLKDKLVLDVGCGNGYHCWRMAGADAQLVVGIDPYLLYVMQFHAIRKFYPTPTVHVLPIGFKEIPHNLQAFDTVFSMGVLYHQRSPFDHLIKLKSFLRPKGDLILETLIIEGEKGEILVPEGRYAKMNNVWFIPTTTMLALWLKKIGFKDIQLLDVSPTTTAEQRVTPWMTFESLADFLSPQDKTKTIEGYAAPRRAIFSAKNK